MEDLSSSKSCIRHFTVYNKVQTKLATFGSELKFSDFFIVKSLKFRSLHDENLPQLRLHIAGNLVIEDDQLGALEAEGPVQIHVLPVLPLPQHEFPPFCRVFPPKLVRGGVANMAAGSPVVLGQHARERIPHCKKRDSSLKIYTRFLFYFIKWIVMRKLSTFDNHMF